MSNPHPKYDMGLRVVRKYFVSWESRHLPSDKKYEELTKAGVDEAVPAAAAGSQQPPSTNARREAECGAENTHQHVADTYVQQQHVHRRPQLLEFAKEQKDNEVV